LNFYRPFPTWKCNGLFIPGAAAEFPLLVELPASLNFHFGSGRYSHTSELKNQRPFEVGGVFLYDIFTAGLILDPTSRNKAITAFPLFDFAASLC
jgi:hypothetical protein